MASRRSKKEKKKRKNRPQRSQFLGPTGPDVPVSWGVHHAQRRLRERAQDIYGFTEDEITEAIRQPTTKARDRHNHEGAGRIDRWIYLKKADAETHHIYRVVFMIADRSDGEAGDEIVVISIMEVDRPGSYERPRRL